MATQPDPPVQLPATDPGNPLIAETPTAINIGHTRTPNGPRVILTMRTPSTTFTTFLDRDTALALAQGLAAEAQQMGGLIVPNAVLR